MARARTRTRSASRTYSRSDLLGIQIVTALRRAYVDRATVDKIRPGLTRRWFQQFAVYGIDRNGFAWCRLVLKIDWARHELHLAAGRIDVEVDERWQDETAIELDEVLRTFEMCCRDNGLVSFVHVWYTPGQDRARIRRELGFVRGRPLPWAGRVNGRGLMDVSELDEFSVGFDVAMP